MTRVVTFFSTFALLTGVAFAHHGWGSYDANKPLTVTGPIVTSKFENPHATITVRGSDKVWVLIWFSNGIRSAKRLAAPQAIGDLDNDMSSCHARKYGTGGSDSKTWGVAL